MMIRTARRELERVMELLLGLPVQSQSHLTATTRREIAMAEAEAAQLAQEYLSLGGRRKTAADDNAMSTRLWQDEPAEAKAYWDSNIAPLPDARRKEVESNLPSISGDSR